MWNCEAPKVCVRDTSKVSAKEGYVHGDVHKLKHGDKKIKIRKFAFILELNLELI